MLVKFIYVRLVFHASVNNKPGGNYTYAKFTK